MKRMEGGRLLLKMRHFHVMKKTVTVWRNQSRDGRNGSPTGGGWEVDVC
jgi:hypothetical protein